MSILPEPASAWGGHVKGMTRKPHKAVAPREASSLVLSVMWVPTPHQGYLPFCSIHTEWSEARQAPRNTVDPNQQSVRYRAGRSAYETSFSDYWYYVQRAQELV